MLIILPTMQILMTVLLVVLPYGTAIICGAITQWAGRTVSGWCSVGGLALGIYFFHKSMELLVAVLLCCDALLIRHAGSDSRIVPIFKEDKWKGAMSAIGTKRTCARAPHMSAFGGKADIVPAPQNVR